MERTEGERERTGTEREKREESRGEGTKGKIQGTTKGKRLCERKRMGNRYKQSERETE
jgi:hypothetical protein